MDVLEPTAQRTDTRTNPDNHADQTMPPRRRLPRKLQALLLLALAGVLIAALLLSGVLHTQRTGDQAEEQPAASESGTSFKPTARQWAGFAIAPVAERTFQAVQETDGKIAFDDDLTTPVYSPFTGRVTALFARMGDSVKRGDKLAAIEATEFVQAQNDLITATAGLKTARAQRALAQTNEKRQHALYLAQGSAQKDWQQSQVDLSTAEGAERGAEIALGAVQNRLRILGRSDQEIAAMQNAPGTVSFSPEAWILAPIGGVVTQRQIGLGQNIVSQSNGGSTALFSIGDLSKVWLLANARETDAPLIHPGDAVEVRVPAYPDRVFAGRISFVAPSIDPTTHRLEVHAEVENPGQALKPEMLASFRITTGQPVVSAAVPEGALVYEGAKVHVWVADDANKTIALREVVIGMIDNRMVQILDGLRPGESVVTAGSLFIDRAVTGD
nr:efflux RND transporter periplasmic adaptor subunit [uncultured Rhodopila sp.]